MFDGRAAYFWFDGMITSARGWLCGIDGRAWDARIRMVCFDRRDWSGQRGFHDDL